MKVTRLQIAARGLSNRCPNCGGRTLFKKGTLFEINPACPDCGLRIERDEGFFLGSMSLNYGLTVVLCLLPLTLLACYGVIRVGLAVILAAAAAVCFPIAFYRTSRSLWLMNYYLVLPEQLPANLEKTESDRDENI